MADLYLKKLEAERKTLWATCRLKGLPKDTPERQRIAAIDQAIADGKANVIHGKATTPFLLARVKDLTGGDSLDSNIQLVYNNARLAAKTACALQTLEQA